MKMTQKQYAGLCSNTAMLYAAVGVHPHDAKSCDENTSERLKGLILDTNKRAQEQGRDKAVVAIGEIGLDYHYDFSPREVQQKVFRKAT